jgi:hypothetical protein
MREKHMFCAADSNCNHFRCDKKICKIITCLFLLSKSAVDFFCKLKQPKKYIYVSWAKIKGTVSRDCS